LEDLTYLGLETVVKLAHPQAKPETVSGTSGFDLTYIHPDSDSDGSDSLDKYIGFDRFDRVFYQRYISTTG
jgi:hypothetical protein